ncbi:MAG: molybdopterin oxidoreductase family protein [Chloroflexi bacterium]|nr:MAG: molybdopterin oxidoreductase family protein [Chloroflexota bacterium]
MDVRTSYATCPLCEATCGLEITTRGREVLSVRGDEQDVFSRGYLCPKAYSLKELSADPDCIRTPMVRRGDTWQAVSWDEAFAEIERNLAPLLSQYGRDALAIYIGNPNVHNLSNLLYLSSLLRAAGTQNVYSASTLDQMPKQVTAGLMFGTMISIPVPDLQRTDYLLLLGANPLVSNGSLMTAPDMRGRLRKLRQRGGKLVVIDPYRTRTAQEADEHHFIRPGSDALVLFAIVHTLFAEGLVAPGKLSEYLLGLAEVRELARAFAPEQVAPLCGIAADTILRLAREVASAKRAVVYGRIGTCTQEFGTLVSWLVDVINVLTGNLDREGGAMFPKAAAGAKNTSGTPGKGRGVRFGRWHSRVSHFPEVFGELPTSCLAEEIETPGEGQVKALLTIAGNPVLSSPDSQRLQAALDKLEYMVSIDIYLNETTRYANVILPPLPPLMRSHYDLSLYQLAVHNVAHYSPPVIEREPGMLDEWEILLSLATILGGQGASADRSLLDNSAIAALVQREIAPTGSLAGRDVTELLAALEPRRGPERMLDFLLRSGPYGDGFGMRQGLSLTLLEAHPHGVDLGPLAARIPEVLRTPSGKIELAPELLVKDVERLRTSLQRGKSDDLLLIGRRDLRSNNSWMHNLHVLTKGKDRCTLHIHPVDAARLNPIDGETAIVSSDCGSVEIPMEITEAIMPGVVSIPHGWGHNLAGTRMHVASEHAGVNMNILVDGKRVDPLSGNAVLNGIAVRVDKALGQ